MKQTILVVVEPRDDQGSLLEKAGRLAAALDARVKLFICTYDYPLADEGLFDPARLEKLRAEWIEHLRGRLYAMAEPLQASGLEVVVDAVWHKPVHEGIEQEAECTGAELVMKNTRPHSLLSRSLFSHTDWQLISRCPSPLMLVKEASWGSTPRLLAAIDPQHPKDKPASLDRRILALGARLAAALQGELHAIHVRAPGATGQAKPESWGWTVPIFPDTTFADAAERELRTTIDTLAGDSGVPPDRVHIESGPVAETLAEFATRRAMDMVIMGAVSRSRLRNVFVGHSAERLLESLSCDVLVVKTAGSRQAEL